MRQEKPRSIPRDLLAGFVAIVFVVGTAIYAQFVGSDLRVLFAVTGTAFYFAGLVRGLSAPLNPVLKSLIVSSPGLLGTAALIMNDGLHRIQIPIAVSLTAIVLTLAGVQTRRFWSSARWKSTVLGLASAVALAGFAAALVPVLVVHSSLKAEDRAVPDFTVAAPDGRVLTSSALRGHVVVLAFWATWCLPCHWELPEVESAYNRFKQNPEVAFWAIDESWSGETPEKARRFLAEKKWTLPWHSTTAVLTRRWVWIPFPPLLCWTSTAAFAGCITDTTRRNTWTI